MVTLKKSSNRKPIEIMLAMGTDDHEILRCLDKTRNKLILSKEKLQNIPKTKNAAIEMICTFNAKSLLIIADWFKKNIEFEDSLNYSKSITILKNTPFELLSSEEFKMEWRSIFCAYCDSKTNEKINEFLKNIESTATPKIKNKPTTEVIKKVIDSKSNSDFSLSKEALIDYINKLKSNQEFISENIFLNLIDGIISAHFSIDDKLKKVKEIFIKEKSDLSIEFLELIETIEKKTNEKFSTRKGTTSKKAVDEFDPENNLTLAEVVNILPTGMFFAKVIGTLVNNQLVEYIGEESKEVYPQRGDIAAYPKTIQGNRYNGEIALWKIERKKTDKNAQYVITDLAFKVYEITSVPHSSNEPDNIREWMQNNFIQSGKSLPIFELEDGVLIKVPGESADLKYYNFEKPLDILKSVTEFQLNNGKRIIPAPLPSSKLKLDCSPAINSIKRILKLVNLQSEFPQFSHNQIISFVEFVKNQNDTPSIANINRALNELNNSINSRNFINLNIDELLKIPSIINDIDLKKKEIISKYEEEIKNARKDLKIIEEEKINLLSSISESKNKARAIENDLTKNIKQVFEKSKANGISTLSEIALFQSFLNPSVQNTELNNKKITVNNGDFLNDLVINKVLDTSKKTLFSIEQACFATGFSPDLFKIILASSAVCGAIGLIGRKKKLLMSAVGQIFANGVSCRVAVSGDIFSFSDLLRLPATVAYAGKSYGMCLGDFLKNQAEAQRGSVIELVGVNRAPPESFIPDLLEMVRSTTSGSSVAWMDLRGEVKSISIEAPVIVIFDFSTGPATFSFDKNLASEFAIVDTDTKWGNESNPESNIEIRPSMLTVDAIKELFNQNSTTIENRDLCDELARCFINLNILDAELLAKTLLFSGRPNQTENRSNSSEKFLLLSKAIHTLSDSIFIDTQKRN